MTPLSETLTYATPLVIASIGVGIAFQTGIFNIGANGQAILGGIAGASSVGSMIHLPTVVAPAAHARRRASSAAPSAGAVPGVLKAYTGAHEVIVTLMFNYVVNALLALRRPLDRAAAARPGERHLAQLLTRRATLSPIFGASSGLRVNWGLVVAAVVVVFAWWFLERSSPGLRLPGDRRQPQRRARRRASTRER